MFYAIVISFVAGFAGGWAFFKHRADIKAKAASELKAAVINIKDRL